MKVLFLDGYNLFHRARHGYSKGEYSTVYTFFRSFRSLVERMDADKAILAVEGFPAFRHELLPEYKANRKADPSDTKKAEEYSDFKRQKDIIVNILSKLPIEILKHKDYEGDDVIGKLVVSVYKDDECTVVTADGDFHQLLDNNTHVKIYNPIKKEYVSKPEFDTIAMKSLTGDKSDNISGIPRIGPKTAQKLLNKTAKELSDWLDEKPERRAVVERNRKLVTFADVPLDGIENLAKETNLMEVKEMFELMEFASILTEKAWAKFEDTFSD